MTKMRKTPLRNTLLVILSTLLMLVLGAHFPVFAQSEDEATSVTLTTELSTYSTETKRILVYWENRGETEFEYGEHWSLERKKDGQWEAVKTNGDYAVNDIAFTLPPEAKPKQVYNLSMYTGNLTPGTYRIAADYTHFRGRGDYTKYPVYAEFTIVKSESYEDKSELNPLDLGADYVDITSGGVFEGTTAHVYRNKKTYHSMLVYEGEKYELGRYAGGWGVTLTHYILDEEREYILYAYSYGEGDGHRSHIAAFDLDKKKIVFRTTAVRGTDHLSFSSVQMLPGYGRAYKIWGEELIVENGLAYGSLNTEELGALMYKDGKFSYEFSESK